MTDPIRWCDDTSNADEHERNVLRSDLDAQPPANLNALVWGKLAAELSLGSALVGVATAEALTHTAASTAQGAGVAATQATKVVAAAGSPLAFVQGVAVGVLACGAVWAGVTLPAARPAMNAAAAPSVAAAAAVAAPARASAEATQDVRPPPELATAKPAPPATSHALPERQLETRSGNPAPSVAAFGEVPDAPRVSLQDRQSQLKEEAALLRQARAELRAGALQRALGLLDESQRRFAAPELSQEREALLIELLARSGQTAAAAARARTFLASFPESPHADRLRAFATP